MPVNFNPANALTNLLYSGEIFDQRTAMQYLRARYYDPASGTFNRLDPFFGRLHDPQSLHKYLYVHADPIQGIDPSGLTPTLGGTLSLTQAGMLVIAGLSFHQVLYHLGPTLGEWLPGGGTQFNPTTVPIDIVIVELETPTPGTYIPWTQGLAQERITKVVEFWKRYGIVIDYSIKTIANDDWMFVEGTVSGTGEIQQVVDESYRGRPVLVLVPETSDEWIGCTSSDGRGAVIELGVGWGVPAHELGHIFGLNHGTAFYLSLSKHNLMRTGGPKSARVETVWLYDYQRYWAHVEILNRGWGH